MGAARRRWPLLDARGARPTRLRLDRSVRRACRRGRRHRARRPGDDDRHRPAAQRRAARQAGGIGRRAVRGPPLSEQLAALRDGDALGVRPDLPLLVGGTVGPAFARMARYADGYAHNGGPPRAFARAAATALAAWSD